MASRIGVDIGGTFTDFIVYDESGNRVIIDKIPTTPQSPEKAVVEVIKRNLSREELEKNDFSIITIIKSYTIEKVFSIN